MKPRECAETGMDSVIESVAEVDNADKQLVESVSDVEERNEEKFSCSSMNSPLNLAVCVYE